MLRPPTDVPTPVFEAIARASAKHCVPLRLLLGVAWVESRYNPKAGPSSAGAVGLMQLLPPTAKHLGVDPWNAEAAADGAARFLASMQRQFGGAWERALAAYNWGPARVRERPDPMQWPGPVRQYVWRVMKSGELAPIPFPGTVWVVNLGKGADG
jgi:peptidoglycan DL-endopeptidase CwlO